MKEGTARLGSVLAARGPPSHQDIRQSSELLLLIVSGTFGSVKLFTMDVGSQTLQGGSTEVLCQYIQVLEPFVMPATIFIDVTTTLCVSSKNRISSPCHRRRGLVRILQWKLVAIPSKLGNAQATKSQGPAYLGPVDMAVATETLPVQREKLVEGNGCQDWLDQGKLSRLCHHGRLPSGKHFDDPIDKEVGPEPYPLEDLKE
jgi:hypothetical protein